MCTRGRNDDGTADSILLVTFSRKEVFNIVGKNRNIHKILIQVGVKHEEKPHRSSFTKIWAPSRTSLNSLVKTLALEQMHRFFADEQLSQENHLVAHPIIKHLRVDTGPLLGQQY